MNKKIFVFALGALLFALCFPTQAQPQVKGPRVGILMSPSVAEMAPFIDAFRQNLRELGYVEGKSIVLEIRGGGAEFARISGLAAELVSLKVNAIVAEGGPAVIAAKKATSMIPIVMRVGTDPVEAGFVDSLAHPGGNITGIASVTVGLSGKRFELLAEAVPGVQRIAVLTAESDPARFMARNTRLFGPPSGGSSSVRSCPMSMSGTRRRSFRAGFEAQAA